MQATESQLLAWALDYLRRFDVSKQRLRQHLLQKAARAAPRLGHLDPADRDDVFAEEAVSDDLRQRVDGVLADLERRRLLDDRRHAEVRLTALQARGLAPAVARARLRQQGVDATVVASAEASVQGEAGETPREAALNAAWAAARRRRLGPYRPAADRGAERERDIAKLMRAGHAFEFARAVIDSPVAEGAG